MAYLNSRFQCDAVRASLVMQISFILINADLQEYEATETRLVI